MLYYSKNVKKPMIFNLTMYFFGIVFYLFLYYTISYSLAHIKSQALG